MLGGLQVIVERLADVVAEGVAPFEALGRLKDAEIHHDLNPLKQIVLIEEAEVLQYALLLLDAWLERQIHILIDVWVLE